MTYTITFDSQGGSAITSVDVVQGESYSPVPGGHNLASVRYDFELLGWFTAQTGGTRVLLPYTPTENVVIYAHWGKARTYHEDAPSADLQAAETRLVNGSLTRLPTPYLTGLKLQAGISLGDLKLNFIEDPTDENGYIDPVIWVCSDIDGWWQQPDVEIPDLPRGWGDGSYDSKGRYTAREITLSGSILVQNPKDTPAARNKLVQATNLVSKGTWLKVDESPSKASFVRLSGRPEITSVNARGRIDFSIDLKAGDPIKYEWVDDSFYTYNSVTIPAGAQFPASRVEVENIGNIPVPAIFRIEGGVASASPGSPAVIYVSSSAGVIYGTITIVAPIAATETLDIDTYSREVSISTSGSDIVTSGRSRTETLLDWAYLLEYPEKTYIEFTDPDGLASLTVLYKSGWIG